MRDAAKNLPRGLILGVLGVIAVYVSVNFVYLRALGAAGLAATSAPASAVMRALLGARGATTDRRRHRFLGVWLSRPIDAHRDRGFISRWREDGVFFRSVARVHPRTRAPVVAIALQGVLGDRASRSAAPMRQVVNYVVAMDCLFIGLAAICLFVLRRRSAAPVRFAVPGHPWTTLLFHRRGMARGREHLCDTIRGVPASAWRSRSPVCRFIFSGDEFATTVNARATWNGRNSAPARRFNLATSGLTNVLTNRISARIGGDRDHRRRLRLRAVARKDRAAHGRAGRVHRHRGRAHRWRIISRSPRCSSRATRW